MKKTKDGRIYDNRIKMSKISLNKIILECKNKQDLTWEQFANKLGVSPYTIRYDWRKKSITIPLSSLKKILRLHPKIKLSNLKNDMQILEPYWGQKIGKKSKFIDKVKIPRTNSPEFAEFYGILLGDGCIYSNLSGFCISGNSILDRHYLGSYVTNLIIKLFNIKPKIYYSTPGKIMRCVLYNKMVVKFLIEQKFPKGNKKANNPKILPEFFKNKTLLKACIRGIQDTDGSIYPQQNSKIILDISIHSESLLESVMKAFQKLGLPVNYTKNRAYLCGKQNVAFFLKEIGSSNIKHIKKYQIFLKTQKVPLTFEMEKLLKQEKTSRIKIPYYGPVV